MSVNTKTKKKVAKRKPSTDENLDLKSLKSYIEETVSNMEETLLSKIVSIQDQLKTPEPQVEYVEKVVEVVKEDPTKDLLVKNLNSFLTELDGYQKKAENLSKDLIRDVDKRRQDQANSENFKWFKERLKGIMQGGL